MFSGLKVIDSMIGLFPDAIRGRVHTIDYYDSDRECSI